MRSRVLPSDSLVDPTLSLGPAWFWRRGWLPIRAVHWPLILTGVAPCACGLAISFGHWSVLSCWHKFGPWHPDHIPVYWASFHLLTRISVPIPSIPLLHTCHAAFVEISSCIFLHHAVVWGWGLGFFHGNSWSRPINGNGLCRWCCKSSWAFATIEPRLQFTVNSAHCDSEEGVQTSIS